MAEHSPSPSRAGRPTDDRKTADILDAARACFFADGFAETSIEKIAKQAGVSKVTIYSRFGDKPGLLEALVKRQSATMRSAIEQMNREAPDLRTKLTNFGNTLIGFLFHADHFNFDAILVSEAERHPGVTQRYFEAGPATMRRELAAILAQANEDGDLDIAEPVTVAEDLLSLWRGFPELELRFGVSAKSGADRVSQCVSHGIDVIFRAYGKR